MSLVLLWALVAVLVVLVVLLYRQFGLMYMGSGESIRVPGLVAGDPAPRGANVELDDVPVALPWDGESDQNSSPTILVLTFPDCSLMREFTPGLESFARRHRSDFGVWVVDNVNAQNALVRDRPSNGGEVRFAISRDGALHQEFDIEISPYVYLIESDGTILDGALITSQGSLTGFVRTYFVEEDAESINPL